MIPIRRVPLAAVALGTAWLLLGAADDPQATNRQVLGELNHVRADPPAYAEELGDYREHFDGRLVTLSDGN